MFMCEMQAVWAQEYNEKKRQRKTQKARMEKQRFREKQGPKKLGRPFKKIL